MAEFQTPISTDKPGRIVRVEVEADEAGTTMVVLSLDGTRTDDAWTWLSAAEAHKTGIALISAAIEADPQKAAEGFSRLP